LKFFVSNFADR